MNGTEVALDSNVAIAVLNDSAGAGTWSQSFSRVWLPVPVIGELRFGALKSQRATQNLDRVEKLVSHCTVLDVTVMTTEFYSRVRLRLKQKGRPIPENDVWIAAICLQHDLRLATFDDHFAEVDGLDLVRP